MIPPIQDVLGRALTAEGYVPPGAGGRFAFAIDGHARAFVVPPKQFLTPELASEMASDAEERADGHPTTIYYFRATEDIDEEVFGGRIALRRVPFDLLRLDIA